MEIKKYIAENESGMLEELFSLIRIPSISAKPEHHDDMLACAERWAQLLLAAGADEALVMPSAGNPIVFGQKIVDPKAKTVLIYAHYDVMPAEPLELWKSNPFEPEVRDGHIWARGADDDKGQSFIQVKAFEYLVKNNLLTHNVKFIFEGEEEIGSPSLEGFCREHKELLKADVILVSDTSMLGADLPSLTTGLRGLAYWEIEVTGPNRDLHSGHFGGAVANPINVLCGMISKVTDADGRITVPGFYDDVEEVPQAEREMIAHIPFDEEKYKKAIGVNALFGERIQHAGAQQLPSVFRCMRHLGRLYGRRFQNRTALQGIRQSILPTGSASGSSQDFATVCRLHHGYRPRYRTGKSHPHARRAGICMPHHAPGIPGCGERLRQSFRQETVGSTSRRQYSHYLHIRAGIRHQNHTDGIRSGVQRHPFSQREHSIGYTAQRNRGGC